MDCAKHATRGLTLVELLVVLAMAGVLLALAVTAFNRLMAANAMAASTNLFLAQLYLARSSAVTRETLVTLCPAAGPSACNDNHRSWHRGYLIFQDDNRNGSLDASESLISFQEAAPNGISIVTSSNDRNRITYRPMGRTWFSNTTVRFCHSDYPDLNRAIVLSNNGRARVVKRLKNLPVRCF